MSAKNIPAILGGTPIRLDSIPYGKQFIDEDDIKAVSECLQGDLITTGPMVEAFERKLCDITKTKFAVAVSSGTAALHAAVYAAGIKEGDEVIISAITFASTANAVLFCGGTPVFADIEEDTFNVNPSEIEKKITSKTKAVIAVDFTGQAVKVDEIKGICKRRNLIYIDDGAHSLGTKYKGVPVGGLADMTTFSFHPVKTITTGEGGVIMTNNEKYYRALKSFRTHGITRDPKLLTINRYDGYNEQFDLGYNYRLTDFQAALGLSQLSKLDEFIKRRKEIVEIYNKELGNFQGIIIQKEILESDTARHIYVIRLDRKMISISRDEFYRALNAEGIGLQVHYMPVYNHPYYKEKFNYSGSCPVAEEYFETAISIPLYYSMTSGDVNDVIKAIKRLSLYFLDGNRLMR
jgi:UDP-4-amino-4,6-dideoxy-N-acetyl-beta-L-altrosamine transaminase